MEPIPRWFTFSADGTDVWQAVIDASAMPYASVARFAISAHLLLSVANYLSDNVAALVGVGDGTFPSPSFFGPLTAPKSVAIGDVNGDQLPDLVLANDLSNNAAVLAGTGDGSFYQASFYGTGERPNSVALGDLNADQVPDVVAANCISNDVAILLGRRGPAAIGTPLNMRPRLGILAAHNRPNPFASSTTIVFLVPAPGPITIGIYDVAPRSLAACP